MPICQAVQHAHQKGIVHRDLKPANILVTMIDAKPVPKVIDFGVAKATAGRLTDESMSTQFGSVVGTLEYMSPEQAGFSGEDIDTRADIYSLGVILYELLTGLRPIDAKRLKNAALTEMIRIIREEEPSKPSTRLSTDESLPSLAALRQTEPRKLMTLLRGELDWVVMKCLEKHRERRYETASGLARDIQRYLADEAVEARPPSAGYRLSKFVRRHKGQVIAASLVLLSLLGGLGAVAAVQTVANAGSAASLTRETKANTALNAANDELTESRAAVQARYDLAVDAIKTFHTGVSEDFLLKEEQVQGAARPAAEVGQRLLRQARRPAGQGDGPGVAAGAGAGQLRGGRPDRQGRPQGGRAGGAPGGAGPPRGAGGRAGGRRRGQGRRRPQPDRRRGPAEIDRQDRRGRGDLPQGRGAAGGPGAVVDRGSSRAAALADCRTSAGRSAVRRRASPPTPWKPTDWRGPIRRRWPPRPGRRTRPGATWRSTINRIGILLSQTGKPSEAEAEYRKAHRDPSRSWPTTTPPSPTSAASLAGSHNNLGILLSETGKPSEAEAEYRKAIAIQQKLADDNPAVTQFRSSLANQPH